MLDLVLKKEFTFWIVLGLAGAGVIVSFMRLFGYLKFVKASKYLDSSRNKYINCLITEFNERTGAQGTKRRDKDVYNVDNFVDKCVLSLKHCGLRMKTWDILSTQIIILNAVGAIVTGILGKYAAYGKTDMVVLIILGILCTAMLIIIHTSVNSGVKSSIIKHNFIDYFEEGYLSVEQEDTSQESIQQESNTNVAVVSVEKDKPKHKLKLSKVEDFDKISQDRKNKIESVSKAKSTFEKKNIDRDALRKAFTDAVYEAALDKMAQQFAQETLTKGKDTYTHMNTVLAEGVSDNPSKSDETNYSEIQTMSQNEVVEAILKDMFK